MIWAILPLVATLSGQALNGTQPRADARSLARIRQALSQRSPLETRNIEPTFRVAIQERTWDRVGNNPNTWENPAPPGGLYGFEQRQRLGNAWANRPLVQIDLLPVAERMIQALKDGRHGRSEREAHEEVVRALSAFCSVNICDVIR
jgi:hypothetical protein